MFKKHREFGKINTLMYAIFMSRSTMWQIVNRLQDHEAVRGISQYQCLKLVPVSQPCTDVNIKGLMNSRAKRFILKILGRRGYHGINIILSFKHWSECAGLLKLLQQVCRGGNLQSGVPDKLLDEVQPLVCDELHGKGDVWGEGAHLLHGPHLILRPALLQGTVDLLGCLRLWEKE